MILSGYYLTSTPWTIGPGILFIEGDVRFKTYTTLEIMYSPSHMLLIDTGMNAEIAKIG